MPIGTCDPASRGEQYNVIELAKANGNVTITVRWSWDGVSTYPNCQGPVQDIRVQNSSAVTYWALLPNKAKGSKWVQIDPGTDRTFSGGTLKQIGLDEVAKATDVQLTTVQPV